MHTTKLCEMLFKQSIVEHAQEFEINYILENVKNSTKKLKLKCNQSCM